MAASATDVLICELNKVNKKDLIYILVHRKIPSNIVVNNTVSEFLKSFMIYGEKSSETEENVSYTNLEVSNIECEKSSCMKNSVQNVFLTKENMLLMKTAEHLENRINDQKMIINLLQNQIKNSKNFPFEKATPSVSSDMNCPQANNANLSDNLLVQNRNLPSISRQKPETSVDTSNKQHVAPAMRRFTPTPTQPVKQYVHTKNNDKVNQPEITLRQVNTAVNDAVETTLAPYTKPDRFRRPVIGSNKNSVIKTVPKLGYLHVYRLNPDTMVEDLTSHLKKAAPSISFSCEKLNSNESSSSFIVKFPINDVKKVYDPNIWPLGACVRRYIFKKKMENSSNFQKQDTQNSLT